MSYGMNENNSNFQLPANLENNQTRHYSLKIIIESIIWLDELLNNDFKIRFFNPINQIIYTTSKNLQITSNKLTYLENIQCRMCLECPPTMISNVLANWSPSILIYDKENIKISQCNLDLQVFNLNKRRERKFETKFFYAQDDKNKKIAEVNIILTMYDHEIEIYNEQKSSNIGLSMFLQISEQLENWKENEKKKFKYEEEQRIKLLYEEWQDEKMKLQQKLINNIQETNNALQEIKMERDLLKTAIETELQKRNIKFTYDVKNAINSKQKIEMDELNELRTKIAKQEDVINSLKQQYENSDKFNHLIKTVESLETKIKIKNSETEYLQQQWGRTIRELNTFKKHYMNLEIKEREHQNYATAFLPLMIQQILNTDAAEQISDIKQLACIRKELNESKTELCQFSSQKHTNPSELDVLLHTQSYNYDDELIKMLNKNDTGKM